MQMAVEAMFCHLHLPPEDALQEWIVSPRVNRSGVGDADPALVEPQRLSARQYRLSARLSAASKRIDECDEEDHEERQARQVIALAKRQLAALALRVTVPVVFAHASS